MQKGSSQDKYDKLITRASSTAPAPVTRPVNTPISEITESHDSACRRDENAPIITNNRPFFDNQLWSINRLAEFLDVPVATIRDWAHKRKIPFLKIGRHIRFQNSDIDVWLLQRRVRCR